MAHLSLAFALLMALPASAVFATSHQSHLSADPQVKQARVLLESKRFAESLVILRALPADHPDTIDIRFLTGLAAMRLSERVQDGDEKTALLTEAIAALRAILISRPGLTRVRLELARAFFLRGADALSREHFERVLAGAPPPAMAVNIRRFLYAMRVRRQWNGYLSLNIEENDNVNTGTSIETVYIFGLPFEVNEESRARSETGLVVSTGFEHQYPLGERWRWRFGVDAQRSEYAGHDFDQNYLQLSSGPRWLFSRRGEASLQAIANQRWRARNRYSRGDGLRFTARHPLTDQFSVNGRASRIKTRYRQFPAADYTEEEFTFGGAWLFSPLLQGSLGVGYTEEILTSGTRNRTRRANIGLAAILPKGWTIGGNLEQLRKKHGFNASLSSDRRLDRKRTTRLFLLNRGLTFFGFSPQLVVTQERQKSNSALDNYHRERVDVRFVRQF